jgi:hypothetical protein
LIPLGIFRKEAGESDSQQCTQAKHHTVSLHACSRILLHHHAHSLESIGCKVYPMVCVASRGNKIWLGELVSSAMLCKYRLGLCVMHRGNLESIVVESRSILPNRREFIVVKLRVTGTYRVCMVDTITLWHLKLHICGTRLSGSG